MTRLMTSVTSSRMGCPRPALACWRAVTSVAVLALVSPPRSKSLMFEMFLMSFWIIASIMPHSCGIAGAGRGAIAVGSSTSTNVRDSAAISLPKSSLLTRPRPTSQMRARRLLLSSIVVRSSLRCCWKGAHWPISDNPQNSSGTSLKRNISSENPANGSAPYSGRMTVFSGNPCARTKVALVDLSWTL